MASHRFSVAHLFDTSALPDALAPLFELPDDAPAWALLERLDAFCEELSDARQGMIHPSAVVEGDVALHESAVIGPHAYVQGPAWIGAGARVGHGAYLRGGVVLAPEANVGHATEIKHALLLPEAKAPHFNYVGDSVLGARVNMGAGVKLANFKADGSKIRIDGVETGRRKLGALLGDDVSIGCNAVLNPGTWIGPRSVVYANASLRGVVGADTVVKHAPELERAARRD